MNILSQNRLEKLKEFNYNTCSLLSYFFLLINSLRRYYHEKDIIDNLITPYFGNIALEKNAEVRKAAIQNLIQFCFICKTSYMESILDILEKVS